MSHPLSKEPITPWYKEPWAWFIVGIVVVSITWGLFQLSVALRKADSVVVDDYYKNGKAINIDLTRNQNAEQLNIQAQLKIDDLTGELRVAVTGNMKTPPVSLKLSLLSPVFANQDQIIILKHSASGDYVGQLTHEITGRYYIQLETDDKLIPEVGYETGWRISNKTDIKPGIAIDLAP